MTLLVTGVIVMLGGGALNALDVFFVTRNLHTPLSAYGALEAVFGAGALLGAVLLSIFARRIGAARTLWASILGIGLLMMVYARLTALTPALVVLFFVGVLNAGINIALGPIVLHVTPRALVGRVMAVLLPVMTLAQVLSIALAGYLASTVLAEFHASVLGQPLGPIDMIFLIAGALAAMGGLYAMGSLRGLRLTGEPGARATPTDHAPDAAEEAEEPEEPAPAPSPLVAR
jgi:MFS family permease